MTDLTAGEIFALRDSMEAKAATVLGRVLFAFSRLEMEVGLCLVWTDGGTNLDELTSRYEESNFNERLEFLRKAVNRIHPNGSKQQTAYIAWLERANQARKIRNELIHGRWGIDAVNGKVVNIIGLPTSSNQRSVGYTITELGNTLSELQSLSKGLHQLREQWPL